jgi:hypothetical protein
MSQTSQTLGVEAGFYDIEEDNSVDQLITHTETDYAELVHRLTAMDGPCTERKEHVARLVYHLATRPKSLRDGLTRTAQEVVGVIGDIFTSSDLLEKCLLRALDQDRERYAHDIEVEIRSRAPTLSDDQTQGLANLVLGLAPAYVHGQKEAWANEFSDLMPLVGESARSAARRGHIQALADKPGGAVERLATFDFHVAKFAEHSLILGDCGPVGFDDHGQIPCRIFEPDVRTICLPLHHSALLVGSQSAGDRIDVESVNSASAAISAEFFVSSRSREGRLIDLLGSLTDLVKHEDREKVRKEFLSGL